MNRYRFTAPILTGLLVLAISSGLAWHFHRMEEKKLLSAFRHDVDQRVAALNRELSLRFEALYTLKALFEGSEVVQPDEFSKIAAETLTRHAPILALAWAPRLSAAPERSCCPLAFLEPRDANQALLDFDLDSVPAIAAGLQAGRDLQPPLHQGLLLLLPVFREEPAEPGGFIVALLPLHQLVADSAGPDRPSGLALALVDQWPPSSRPLLAGAQPPSGRTKAAAMLYRTPLIETGDRTFTVLAWPTADYLSRRHSNLALLPLLVGLIVTLLLVSYLRMAMRRATDIEQLVEERTRKLHEANSKLASLSMTDGLTGIANRRNFDSHLEVEWKRAIREQQPLTLILVDIDHFKGYNDRYGHLAGDHCLRRIAQVLHDQASRPGDLVARYGGEEFALVLPHTDRAARALGAQCRTAVEHLRIAHDTSPTAPWVTVSAGIASLVPARNSHSSELIALADRALYQAKQQGRNQIVLAAWGPKAGAAGVH
jgi:diguanylate cyclase (GGDEF)-like protein